MLYERMIVAVIVGGALLYVGRAVRRSWRAKGSCGCGSAECPAAREAADRLLPTAAEPRKGTAAPVSGRARRGS